MNLDSQSILAYNTSAVEMAVIFSTEYQPLVCQEEFLWRNICSPAGVFWAWP